MAVTNPASFITLGELMQEAADSREEDAILDKLKTLAINFLLTGWMKSEVINFSWQELFGEEDQIDGRTLNRIRFALPTGGIARAFNPNAASLSERKYRELRVAMLQWPFCRALLISPPAIVNKIRGSATRAELFSQLIKPVRELFASRGDTSEALKRSAKEAGLLIDDEEPAAKRDRVDALRGEMHSMSGALMQEVKKVKATRQQTSYNEESSDGENYSSDESYSEEAEEAPWTASNLDSGEQAIDMDLMKKPTQNLITAEDLANYKTIFQPTHAHSGYRAGAPLNLSRMSKDVDIITKLFTNQAKQGNGLPQYMVAPVANKINSVHWDDKNELVDRLRLLLASQNAGNFNHNNEIMSIIEELRQAGVVY